MNDEKRPTTNIQNPTLDGIRIVSRYDKLHEITLMQAVLLTISPKSRVWIEEIFCDSKATANYTVTIKKEPVLNDIVARAIISDVVSVLVQEAGGYNFVELRWRGVTVAYRDAYWASDDDEITRRIDDDNG